jgi:hypothetical protein
MVREIAEGQIVSSGLDWITATFKPDFPHVRDLDAMVKSEQAVAVRRGEKLRIMSPQGYSGQSSDHLFFGGRPDGYMVRVSSDPCNTFYKELMGFDEWLNSTRLDLQVSAMRKACETGFAPRMRAAVRLQEALDGRSRPIEIGTVDKVLGGDGITLHPRKSEVHFRIYDKTHEQKGKIFKQITRFEVELKGDTARAAWGMLKQSKAPQGIAQRLLATRLQKAGIKDEWMRDKKALHLPTIYKATDDERRLEWLEKHVRGTIDRLKESGLEDEARVALGLLCR